MKKHIQKLNKISAEISETLKDGRKLKFQKTKQSHLVPNPYKKKIKSSKIDLTNLTDILEINSENMTCTAEPGVTFETIVKETLKHGLVPLTVPELKGITIGGAVSGCSIESMSFKSGGFHDSALFYEFITPKGEIINCSKEENSDLFNMIHGSYGTLGALTLIKFKLTKAKKFVKMEYKKYSSIDSFHKDMLGFIDNKKYDFIDGIIHSNSMFVLCLGKMVDSPPFTSKYDFLNIFYKSTINKDEDYLTTYDYFFRYDAECHWITKTFPPLEWKPVRFLIGKFVLGSTNLIRFSGYLKPILKLKKRQDIVIDVFIPNRNFKNFYSWYEKEFNFFPLWIVPYKMPEFYPWISEEHKQKTGELLMIDCAIYGKKNNHGNKDLSKLLEEKVFELSGTKTLISKNHYTKERFWQIYNKKNIESIKTKLDPDNLLENLYDKFAPETYGPEAV